VTDDGHNDDDYPGICLKSLNTIPNFTGSEIFETKFHPGISWIRSRCPHSFRETVNIRLISPQGTEESVLKKNGIWNHHG